MDSIKKAIEEFKNRRLGVYQADPDQIVRDTRVAERATKDHVGRWLFELLQNSDDAEASEVRIIIVEDTIYVADNGHGFKPEAVNAICGTDFSDKTAGTIGRKGVGFKSVYEVSRNPQVLTLDKGGIEFSPDKAKAWLKRNELDDGHVPYQWIPFFIHWDDVEQRDPKLRSLTSYKTVIRLPGLSQEKKQKVEQLLQEWPPHALFAFRHLREITAPGLEVVITASDDAWSLRDNRCQTPGKWRVVKHTEHPPTDILELLGADERQAVSADGVSFLIAAPFENDWVVPTTDYLPVHVFYPTEQKGPVRLLLHAEFLVKSDRTALLPVDSSPFNAWVANRLAYHVCQFVNGSYRAEAPSTHVALLVPFGDRASHPVSEDLWQRIAHKALADLRLADVEGRQLLTVSEARLISVSVRADLARTLLEATSFRGQLLHPAFDNDKDARNALRELGCEEIHDQHLMATIAENADSLSANTQWVWACWEWLATWVAKEPYGEKHKGRIEQAKSLPVVPIEGSVMKSSALADCIVTWKPDTGIGHLPDWLPLTFVTDWFRDRIRGETEQESLVRKFSKELGIEEPGADVIQRAVGQSIEQYWKDKQGDPGRFLDFIMERDWHETADTSPSLRRCPVPLSQSGQSAPWAEAGTAYFGREWGNDLLAELYDGVAVAWAAKDGTASDMAKQRRVLEWLGVAHCPRIVEECQDCTVQQLPESCAQWNSLYLDTARDHCGRCVERITRVSKLDHLVIDALDEGHGVLLIRLVAQHWEAYYRYGAKVDAEGSRSRERCYRKWQVKAKWWWEICERLPLPKRGRYEEHFPLTALWLPDKRTNRAIGDLVPVVDVKAFGNDIDAVQSWLVSAAGLRTRIEQLPTKEWQTILSKHIPENVPAESLVSEERLRDKVTGWYAACIETVVEQENVSERSFASCPLLCRKGDVWQYIEDEPRYLNDDNDLAAAFTEDVWLFHIPARLYSEALKYFGIRPLSQLVEVNVTPGEPQSPLSGELDVQFSESLPYVWAWRSSQSKQAADRLSSRLKELKVVVAPDLKANLSLGDVRREVVRRWHINDDTIYLHKDHANQTELAQALAKALDIRSEADFYENLLRCTKDCQRKEKLLSKGIADVEIDRCRREYLRPPAEEGHGPSLEQPTPDEPDGSISPPPSNNGIGGQQPKESIADEWNGTLKKPLEPHESGKTPLLVKDSSTVPYDLGCPPKKDEHIGGVGGDGATAQEDRSLTDTEKAVLEKTGREFAARELERMGYLVEMMPQSNPGFDLRAKRNGDELRVEVKAHSGRATVVDVTQREYKEYLGQQGYRWELWNVEHLAENDAHDVSITRYDTIPDDALDVRTFRIDLKKCQAS